MNQKKIYHRIKYVSAQQQVVEQLDGEGLFDIFK